MTTQDNPQKGYAAVNGLKLYYEIHGSGEPLIVLPGAFMTVEAMGEIVPEMSSPLPLLTTTGNSFSTFSTNLVEFIH